MKILLFLFITQVSFAAQACLITLSDKAHNDDAIILQTNLIKKVIRDSKNDVWVTTSSGTNYKVSESVPEVNSLIRNCRR